MVYRVYYDASSKEEKVAEPLVLAGIAATEAKWIQFEQDWRRVLAKYDVEFLDMAKCAQWMGYPYDTWNRDEKGMRIPFLGALIKILRQAATQIVVVRIIPKDFNAVNARYRLGTKFYPSAYPIAAVKCMGMVETIFARRPEAYALGHIFELGDAGQGALKLLLPLGVPLNIWPKQDPHTKRWIHPFGACDMVAWEYRKRIKERLENVKRTMRGSLIEIRKIPTKTVYMDQKGLTAMCEADPKQFPRRS